MDDDLTILRMHVGAMGREMERAIMIHADEVADALKRQIDALMHSDTLECMIRERAEEAMRQCLSDALHNSGVQAALARRMGDAIKKALVEPRRQEE